MTTSEKQKFAIQNSELSSWKKTSKVEAQKQAEPRRDVIKQN